MNAQHITRRLYGLKAGRRGFGDTSDPLEAASFRRELQDDRALNPGLISPPSTALRQVLGAGRLGRKGKSGFYVYDEKGKRGDVDESVYQIYPGGTKRTQVPKEEIQRRLSLAMVNEAAKCLEEGKTEKECHAHLATECKGIAIGRYCGMRHRH